MDGPRPGARGNRAPEHGRRARHVREDPLGGPARHVPRRVRIPVPPGRIGGGAPRGAVPPGAAPGGAPGAGRHAGGVRLLGGPRRLHPLRAPQRLRAEHGGARAGRRGAGHSVAPPERLQPGAVRPREVPAAHSGDRHLPHSTHRRRGCVGQGGDQHDPPRSRAPGTPAAAGVQRVRRPAGRHRDRLPGGRQAVQRQSRAGRVPGPAGRRACLHGVRAGPGVQPRRDRGAVRAGPRSPDPRGGRRGRRGGEARAGPRGRGRGAKHRGAGGRGQPRPPAGDRARKGLDQDRVRLPGHASAGAAGLRSADGARSRRGGVPALHGQPLDRRDGGGSHRRDPPGQSGHGGAGDEGGGAGRRRRGLPDRGRHALVP